MTIVSTPGGTTYPSIDWGATGATLGVRLTRKTDGVDVVARTTVGVVESPAASELYAQAAGLVAPTTSGSIYMYVWDNTIDYVAEDLAVTTAASEIIAGGDTIYPSVNWGTPGETLGVSIRRKTDGVDVVARTTVGVAEYFPGVYVAAAGVVVPTTAGALYEVVFDNTVDFAAEDLTVAASATGTDLCSVAQVRAYLQKSVGETAQDAIIQEFITAASAAIERYASREFADKGTLTRTFAVNGSLVDLLPYDLRAATAVTLDPAGSPVVLPATQYGLYPATTTTLGTYIQLRTSRYTYLSNERYDSFGEGTISITGSWGAAAVPADIQHAAIVTAGLWIRREVAARGSANPDYEVDGFDLRPLAIPGAAMRMIDPYRRTVYA